MSEKNFYWVEGVTRTEVLKSLGDDNTSKLRIQRNRRILVAIISISLLVSGLTVLIELNEFRKYLEMTLMATILGILFLLRKSIRLVADAPSELLDEYQVSIRNRGYYYSYRWMTLISSVYAIFFYSLHRWGGNIEFLRLGNDYTFILLSFLLWLVAIPTITLAWIIPTEN